MPATIEVSGGVFLHISEALSTSEEALKRAGRKLSFGDMSAKREILQAQAMLTDLRAALGSFLVPDLIELWVNLIVHHHYLQMGIGHLYEPLGPRDLQFWASKALDAPEKVG